MCTYLWGRCDGLRGPLLLLPPGDPRDLCRGVTNGRLTLELNGVAGLGILVARDLHLGRSNWTPP